MVKLTTEYTDIKDIRHQVEHIVPSSADENRKERITEELLNILSKPKKIPA